RMRLYLSVDRVADAPAVHGAFGREPTAVPAAGNDALELEAALHRDRRGALANAAVVPRRAGAERAVQIVSPAMSTSRRVEAAAVRAAEGDLGERDVRRNDGRAREHAGRAAVRAVDQTPAPHAPFRRQAAR